VSVLTKLVKGFLYGTVIGIFMALAVYLLASSVVALGFITTSPTLLGGIVFAACITAGVGMEYADWIDSQNTEAAPAK
jgi:hypothetical protein